MTKDSPEYVQISHEEIYSGEIDWNEIYRRFYALPEILAQLEEHLRRDAPNGSPIVYAGFGEIAAGLSVSRTLRLIEYSDYMAASMKREFPQIAEIVNADIVQALANDDSPIVMIVCRITAYWHHPENFLDFIKNTLLHRRELVMIDLLDVEKLTDAQPFCFVTAPDIESSVTIKGRTTFFGIPKIELVQLEGEYRIGSSTVNFDTTRAFYSKAEIAELAVKLAPDYSVEIHPPIIRNDPSFLLMLKRKVKKTD